MLARPGIFKMITARLQLKFRQTTRVVRQETVIRGAAEMALQTGNAMDHCHEALARVYQATTFRRLSLK